MKQIVFCLAFFGLFAQKDGTPFLLVVVPSLFILALFIAANWKGGTRMKASELVDEMISSAKYGDIDLSEMNVESVDHYGTYVLFNGPMDDLRVNIQSAVLVLNSEQEIDRYIVYITIRKGKAEIMGIELDD